VRFGPEDLSYLERYFYNGARGVVALREIFAGNRDKYVIGLRHDIDHEAGAFECGLRLAQWEADRGFRATYYLLHTADYWRQPDFADGVRKLAQLGHEVGLHNDAMAKAYALKLDPHEVFAEALAELRATGVPVRSTVAHGNRAISEFVRNDEIFVECARPKMGKNTRRLPNGMKIRPRSLEYHGLDFEAARTLGRGLELCDSGGSGWIDIELIYKKWPHKGQLHINQHPDWWQDAV
jgi:hypothetical protein